MKVRCCHYSIHYKSYKSLDLQFSTADWVLVPPLPGSKAFDRQLFDHAVLILSFFLNGNENFLNFVTVKIKQDSFYTF